MVIEKNLCPTELFYTPSHEWVLCESDVMTVGITEHAQEQLGDVVFVDLPEIGNTYAAGDDVAVIESVKTAADIYCPAAGKVIAINETLTQTPENVNQAPYSDGWLFKIKLDDPEQLKSLLSAQAYQETIHAE